MSPGAKVQGHQNGAFGGLKHVKWGLNYANFIVCPRAQNILATHLRCNTTFPKFLERALLYFGKNYCMFAVQSYTELHKVLLTIS